MKIAFRKGIRLWFFLASIGSACIAQDFTLEAGQAYSLLTTTSNDNGSVLVLQNKERDISAGNAFHHLTLGDVVLADSLANIAGKISYKSTYSVSFIPLKPITFDFDEIALAVSDQDVLRVGPGITDFIGTYDLTMSSGAVCFESGYWSSACSANLKNLKSPIRSNIALTNINNLPIYHWNYKHIPSETHIGPTAEDFHILFNKGNSQENLASIDVLAVCLAASQDLINKLNELENELLFIRNKIIQLK